ncbi:MAG: hypothetical protein RIQ76_812, partial [Pseudomonadota bacterium]
ARPARRAAVARRHRLAAGGDHSRRSGGAEGTAAARLSPSPRQEQQHERL